MDRKLGGLIVLTLAVGGHAQAQTVYSCKGADGQKVFSQRPCGSDAVEVKVKPASGVGDPNYVDSTVADLTRTTKLQNAEYGEGYCREAAYRTYGTPIDQRIEGLQRRIALLRSQVANLNPKFATASTVAFASSNLEQIATLENTIATERATIEPTLAPYYARCAEQRAKAEADAAASD